MRWQRRGVSRARIEKFSLLKQPQGSAKNKKKIRSRHEGMIFFSGTLRFKNKKKSSYAQHFHRVQKKVHLPDIQRETCSHIITNQLRLQIGGMWQVRLEGKWETAVVEKTQEKGKKKGKLVRAGCHKVGRLALNTTSTPQFADASVAAHVRVEPRAPNGNEPDRWT